MYIAIRKFMLLKLKQIIIPFNFNYLDAFYNI